MSKGKIVRQEPEEGTWGWRAGILLPDVIVLPRSEDTLTFETSPLGSWDAFPLEEDEDGKIIAPTEVPQQVTIQTFVNITPDVIRQLATVSAYEGGIWEGNIGLARLAQHLDHTFRRLAEERKLLFVAPEAEDYDHSVLALFHTCLYSRMFDPIYLLLKLNDSPESQYQRWTVATPCTAEDITSQRWWDAQTYVHPLSAIGISSIHLAITLDKSSLSEYIPLSSGLFPGHAFAQKPSRTSFGGQDLQSATTTTATSSTSPSPSSSSSRSPPSSMMFADPNLPQPPDALAGLYKGSRTGSSDDTLAFGAAGAAGGGRSTLSSGLLGDISGLPLFFQTPAATTSASSTSSSSSTGVVGGGSTSLEGEGSPSLFTGTGTPDTSLDPRVSYRATKEDIVALLSRSAPALALLPRSLIESAVALSFKVGRLMPACVERRLWRTMFVIPPPAPAKPATVPTPKRGVSSSSSKTTNNKGSVVGRGEVKNVAEFVEEFLDDEYGPDEVVEEVEEGTKFGGPDYHIGAELQLLLPLWLPGAPSVVHYGCDLLHCDGALAITYDPLASSYVPYAIVDLTSAMYDVRIISPLKSLWLRTNLRGNGSGGGGGGGGSSGALKAGDESRSGAGAGAGSSKTTSGSTSRSSTSSSSADTKANASLSPSAVVATTSGAGPQLAPTTTTPTMKAAASSNATTTATSSSKASTTSVIGEASSEKLIAGHSKTTTTTASSKQQPITVHSTRETENSYLHTEEGGDDEAEEGGSYDDENDEEDFDYGFDDDEEAAEDEEEDEDDLQDADAETIGYYLSPAQRQTLRDSVKGHAGLIAQMEDMFTAMDLQNQEWQQLLSGLAPEKKKEYSKQHLKYRQMQHQQLQELSKSASSSSKSANGSSSKSASSSSDKGAGAGAGAVNTSKKVSIATAGATPSAKSGGKNIAPTYTEVDTSTGAVKAVPLYSAAVISADGSVNSAQISDSIRLVGQLSAIAKGTGIGYINYGKPSASDTVSKEFYRILLQTTPSAFRKFKDSEELGTVGTITFRIAACETASKKALLEKNTEKDKEAVTRLLDAQWKGKVVTFEATYSKQHKRFFAIRVRLA